MPAFHDKTGLRYGRLVALEPRGSDRHGYVRWLCRCDCGSETTVVSISLVAGRTKSCGCLARELTAARDVARLTTHGQWKSPTYRSWQSMLGRCRNPRATGYKNYGGRGIGLDDPRWCEYPPFRADMGERPPGCQLHRKDNDKGYSKENCVWLSRSEHARLHASLRRRKATFLPPLSGDVRS